LRPLFATIRDMKDRIVGLLRDLGIGYRWVDHPAVFTVAESRQHIEGHRPIKNLLLQESGGRKILVLMAGDERLDTKLIASELGTRKLHFADAQTLERTLGVTPGAVSVFGLLYDGSSEVEVVVDEQLLAEPELGFHPNDNTATLFIRSSALEQIIRRTGHKYVVTKFY
jgi:Ala-tRNA(Pro) deacylase